MKKLFFILFCILLCCGCQETASLTAEPSPLPTAVPPSAVPTAMSEQRINISIASTTTLAPTIEPKDGSEEMEEVHPDPASQPELTPEPEPTPEPTPTPDPNRPMIALTFDDGPNPEKTAPILDLLEQYHIPATFFVLGTSINETTSPLLQRMVDAGCEIGIHGMTHGSMENYSPSSLEKQLLEMKSIISDRIEGGYTPRLMRPPGGHYNEDVIGVARRTELVLVMWSVDTLDWQVSKEEVLQTVKNHTRNGSIILCHDRGSGTLAAATQFIPYLLEQGYDFVTVSELLARYGAPAEPGTVYSSAVVR